MEQQTASRGRRALKILHLVLRILAWALVGLLLAYNVYVLVARYAFGEGIPTVFGYGCAVVETGSMEPEIAAGDFILIRAQEEYAVGDMITFYDSARGEYVTHRVIAASESGYTTKGDANNVQDSFTVPHAAVVGKVVGVLGWFGSVIAFLQTPFGILVLLAAAAACWGISALVRYAVGRRREAAEGEAAPPEKEENGEQDG